MKKKIIARVSCAHVNHMQNISYEKLDQKIKNIRIKIAGKLTRISNTLTMLEIRNTCISLKCC